MVGGTPLALVLRRQDACQRIAVPPRGVHSMNRSPVVGIIGLAIGVALLVWGAYAYDSVSSGFSRAFQGTPSEKAIVLLAAGAIACIFGVVNVMRVRRA
jgi:hypothetical protein